MRKKENKDLALFGGPKVINKALKSYNPIGSEEVNAVKQVVESGVLSKFLGCWDPDFYGGPKVQFFERQCEKSFRSTRNYHGPAKNQKGPPTQDAR